MKPYGKSERTGLILVAAVALAVTGVGFLAKGCYRHGARENIAEPYVMVDTLETQCPGRKSGEPAKKRGNRKRGSKKKDTQSLLPPRDMLSDTVPKNF